MGERHVDLSKRMRLSVAKDSQDFLLPFREISPGIGGRDVAADRKADNDSARLLQEVGFGIAAVEAHFDDLLRAATPTFD